MSEYTPSVDKVRDLYADARAGVGEWTRFDDSVKRAVEDAYAEFDRMIAKVRAETVGYVAQIASDTLRMCQAGGVGERNILPPEQEAGFQLCIDNIANLAKSMKGEQE